MTEQQVIDYINKKRDILPVVQANSKLFTPNVIDSIIRQPFVHDNLWALLQLPNVQMTSTRREDIITRVAETDPYALSNVNLSQRQQIDVIGLLTQMHQQDRGSAPSEAIECLNNPTPYVEACWKKFHHNGDWRQTVKLYNEQLRIQNIHSQQQAINFLNQTGNLRYLSTYNPTIITPNVQKFILSCEKCKDIFTLFRNPKIQPIQQIKERFIKKFPIGIKDIDKPSQKLKLLAVQADPAAISYIEKPSKEVKTAAINANIQRLDYIRDTYLHYSDWKTALKKDPQEANKILLNVYSRSQHNNNGPNGGWVQAKIDEIKKNIRQQQGGDRLRDLRGVKQ